MSSPVSLVFNRNVWKFVLAVSIPLSIGYFFWDSQQKAEEEVRKFKLEQKEHPTTDRVSIDNYSMKEIDDNNHIRWQLIANTGVVLPNGKDVELSGVKVEYYDPQTKEMKMRLKAPVGHANQETKYVKLNGDQSTKVLAEGGGFRASHFECAQVELAKNNQFLASGGVIIDWPGVAKVSGDTATGSTDMSSGPKNLKVVGNTHAQIAVR
jgi:hypothetical protein